LRDIRLVVQRRLPVIAAAAALFVVAGAAITTRLDPEFTASATISAAPSTDAAAGSGNLQQLRFIAPSIEAEIASSELRESTAPDVPLIHRDVRVRISARSDPPLIRVRGVSQSPEAAQAWTTAVANRFVEAQATDGPFVYSVNDPATLPRAGSTPEPTLVLGAALLTGLLAGVGLAIAADRITEALRETRRSLAAGKPSAATPVTPTGSSADPEPPG
jgi:capsular polysaccharide biosynthesis protein